jgi:hypothetical protein
VGGGVADQAVIRPADLPGHEVPAVPSPGRLRRRWRPIAVSALVLVSGLAYCFFWVPVVHHGNRWVEPGDIWQTFRSAHYVGWGDIGGIYTGGTHLVTFPGIAVLLAPVAMISGALGLSESIAPFYLAHPAAWFLLGPAEILLGTPMLFALDAVAERCALGPTRRSLLAVMEGFLLWQVVVLWGHPEDALALGLAVYALLAGLDGKWTASGWLWGASVVVQPLTGLILPIAVAQAPRGIRLRLCVQAALPSVVLLAIPLATNWSATTNALLRQPNYPTVDHPTPWMAFAPVLRPHVTVSAGPPRSLAVLGALGLGIWSLRRRWPMNELFWLAGLALSLRCVFEAVMDPYYLVPPAALIVTAAFARQSRWRPTVAALAMVVDTIFSYHHLGEWAYWVPMVALLAVGLACGWPWTTAPGSAPPPDDASCEPDTDTDTARAPGPAPAPTTG